MTEKRKSMPNTPGRQAAQAKYNSKPEQRKRRAQRNAARAAMIKAGYARKGDGKDVAHLDDNTSHNSMVNLAMQTKAQNRSFKRNSKGGHKK
jgi:hypothetical protein